MLTLPKNDIGSDIELDTDISLTDVSLIQMHVTKPSGATATWTAIASGAAEEIVHTTASGDLNEAGFYKVHAYLEFTGGDAFTGTDTILEVTDGTASTEAYLALYWSGLKAQLDAVDTGLYSDMVMGAVSTLANFDTSFLTAGQIKQAYALLVCVSASEMPSVPGFSQEKFVEKFKVYDRVLQKPIGLDWAVGAFCRLLKITLSEFNAKTSSVRTAQYNIYKTNSIFLGHDLDQRGKVFRDYDLSDVRDDREAYPLDNRYL